jgi:hypothetical protein
MSFVGDLLSSGVSAVIGSIGTAAKDIKTAITGKETETEAGRLKIMELANQIENAALEADKGMNIAQIELNKIEAADPSVFKSGWRPAVGWICVAGLCYQFLVVPLFPWTANIMVHLAYAIFPKVEIFSHHVPVLPNLDMGPLMTLLFGMLGLGGLRTFEKVKGLK